MDYRKRNKPGLLNFYRGGFIKLLSGVAVDGFTQAQGAIALPPLYLFSLAGLHALLAKTVNYPAISLIAFAIIKLSKTT